MATIGAAVSAGTKDKFDSIARERNVTASRLAASLIEGFLLQEAKEEDVIMQTKLPPMAKAPGGPKTEQVFVRMDTHYFAELGRLARERNWYRSTYLANLFQAHVDRRPRLCDAEIDAVRQVARQLADFGRNLNQLAKRLNASTEHAHMVNSIDFELVRMVLESESNAIRDLIKANLRGWGVYDAEA